MGLDSTSNVPAPTYVNDGSGYPVISSSSWNVISAITDSTWERVGPTGSGKNNEWPTLDLVPTGASYIRVKIVSSVYKNSATSVAIGLSIFTVKDGGTESSSDATRVQKISGVNVPSIGHEITDTVEATIPVASRFLKLRRVANANNGTTSSLMYLIGWGFNP